MSNTGDRVIDLLTRAKQPVLVVAPFIKRNAFNRLLDAVPQDLQIKVVTRWLPNDILAGVSDLHVYELMAARSNTMLYLRNDLHAKFIATGDTCMSGSANVTDRALGWGQRENNLELMVTLPRDTPEIIEFEESLFDNVVVANRDLKNKLQNLVDGLSDANREHGAHQTDPPNESVSPTWCPRIRNPEELFAVYSGDPDVSYVLREEMVREIQRLGVVSGLSEPLFKQWVGATISQTPLMARLIETIELDGNIAEQSFERLLLDIGIDIEFQIREYMQIIFRWLIYFVSPEFHGVADSFRIVKVKESD